ncbi:cobalt-precorrin 5A hydrolase [Ruminococcus sp. 5_1_39BFAA]|uniref:cobalt-precorrin 5A hydrolase n=1 Tax=Ruminococcus sp. 5_1_39BFAA TaxID=457412 RepID=UPI003564613C
MKISMICYSLTGWETGEKLKEGLEKNGYEVSLSGKSKYLPDSIPVSCKSWAEEQFEQADGIIFIGACGIAVRSIAPFVASKKTDPAVLVADECGKFVISLLSGHLGGANDLALAAAEILKAVPVVTTATDLHSRFAVDVFAKKNGCAIFNMKAAKEVSAALLAGKKVGFYSEFPWEGELPEGLTDAHDEVPEIGIAVTIHKDCNPFSSTVHVVPSVVSLGMGCRRGKDGEGTMRAAERCLESAAVYREALKGLYSIDLKKDEEGLLALSEKWKLPFQTFSEEELLALQGDFTPSAFVKKTVGVDNVCERSAVLGACGGNLIEKKQAADGVTAALAIEDWRIRFE